MELIGNNNINPLINDNYFQTVPLKSIKEPEVSITINNKEFVKYDDYVILSAGENDFDVKSKQVIYVGYGINDSIYSDYENVDVKNKIVIAIKGEPKNEEGNYSKPNGKRRRKFIEYNDTDFTKDVRNDLEAYNRLLQETYIDIATLDEPFVIRTKKDGSTQRIKIDQSKKFVRRIFSRGDWKYNGRFYGGFWQQVGSEYRKDIYINGSPTVEVDYKGLHAAILSAEKGIVYGGDRYELGSAVCPKLDKQQQRKAVKLLVLAAINAKDRSSAFGAFRQAQPTGSVEKTLTHDELGLLLDTFLKQHPYLEDGICSDQGIRLMNVDSHITNFIIKEFVTRQKPILSVHDSYIVDTRDVELLRD